MGAMSPSTEPERSRVMFALTRLIQKEEPSVTLYTPKVYEAAEAEEISPASSSRYTNTVLIQITSAWAPVLSVQASPLTSLMVIAQPPSESVSKSGGFELEATATIW